MTFNFFSLKYAVHTFPANTYVSERIASKYIFFFNPWLSAKLRTFYANYGTFLGTNFRYIGYSVSKPRINDQYAIALIACKIAQIVICIKLCVDLQFNCVSKDPDMVIYCYKYSSFTHFGWKTVRFLNFYKSTIYKVFNRQCKGK